MTLCRRYSVFKGRNLETQTTERRRQEKCEVFVCNENKAMFASIFLFFCTSFLFLFPASRPPSSSPAFTLKKEKKKSFLLLMRGRCVKIQTWHLFFIEGGVKNVLPQDSEFCTAERQNFIFFILMKCGNNRNSALKWEYISPKHFFFPSTVLTVFVWLSEEENTVGCKVCFSHKLRNFIFFTI